MASNEPRRPGLVWLLAAAGLLLFANGRHPIAIAAWLAPVLLLRFVRLQRPGPGLSLAFVALAATWTFQFRGMAPLPPAGFVTLAVFYGLAGLLPYVADRLVAPRLQGLQATLVLPSAWVAVEYLVATFSPYGSWGAAAYSQHEHLTLLQLASVTGLYGVSFLIAWFASVCNLIWERGFSSPAVRASAGAYLAAVALVLLLGGARLAVAPQAPAIRIASLSAPEIDLFATPEAAERAYAGTSTAEDIEEIRQRARRIDDDLLSRSRREARAGARIVFWGETNAFVFKDDEPDLLRRATEVAVSEGVYLGVAVATWDRNADRPLENKLVLIAPDGETALQTLKAVPIPGGESAISARDDGRIKTTDTPYGRIGAAICFDMDFPALLAQAGRSGVDIMLVPSNDWREIDPWHSHMARFRAVEQGFNLVRHTSHGLSLAADTRGRVLDSMDHYTTDDRTLISRVPTRGVRTIYSRIGDVFAWLCIAGLGWLAFRSRRRGVRSVTPP